MQARKNSRTQKTSEEEDTPSNEPNEGTELTAKERFEARKAALWLSPRKLTAKSKDPYQVILACRAQAPLVIKRLIELTKSNHGPTAVKACETILNRAYGRAPVTVDITHKLTADRALLEQAAIAILERRAQRQLSNKTFDNGPLVLADGTDRDGATDSGGYAAVEGGGGVERVPLEKGSSTYKHDSIEYNLDADGEILSLPAAKANRKRAPKSARLSKGERK